MTKETAEHLIYICKYQTDRYYNFHGGVIPFDDLLDEAHKALLYALKYFKEGAGRQLKSYCTMCIMRRLSHYSKQHKDKFKNTYEYTAENDHDINLNPQEAKITNAQQKIIQDNQELVYVDADKDEYFKWLLKTRKLNKREKDVMRKRYQGQISREIAKVYGVSTQRIDQIYQKGLKILKERHNRETEKVEK